MFIYYVMSDYVVYAFGSITHTHTCRMLCNVVPLFLKMNTLFVRALACVCVALHHLRDRWLMHWPLRVFTTNPTTNYGDTPYAAWLQASRFKHHRRRCSIRRFVAPSFTCWVGGWILLRFSCAFSRAKSFQMIFVYLHRWYLSVTYIIHSQLFSEYSVLLCSLCISIPNARRRWCCCCRRCG